MPLPIWQPDTQGMAQPTSYPLPTVEWGEGSFACLLPIKFTASANRAPQPASSSLPQIDLSSVFYPDGICPGSHLPSSV